MKAQIRQLLPIGLQESLSKVRAGVAYAISAIAHWDWPEAWPELFDILMQALTSGNQDAVHGAMRVLTGKSYEWALTLSKCMRPNSPMFSALKCDVNILVSL